MDKPVLDRVDTKQVLPRRDMFKHKKINGKFARFSEKPQ